MYVRRYARIRFFDILFPDVRILFFNISKSTVIFPFPFVDSAKVGIKKEPHQSRYSNAY